MSPLRHRLDEYLAVRRALGYKLERAGKLLAQFVAFLEHRGAETVTTELALEWATLPPATGSNWHRQRLTVVRGFATWLNAIDPACEVPPADLLSWRPRRAVPYLYRDVEIAALMAAAAILSTPHRTATLRTLIGLLAVTGMRVGEALALERDDVDLTTGVITIRTEVAKLHRARLVPLHATTNDALRRYTTDRERLCPRPQSAAFFLSRGTALGRSGVAKTLRQITTALGMRSEAAHPRAKDLRHAFAIRTLIDWQQTDDVAPRIAVLSTYLGHVSPAETYWYLSATPELMGAAAERLHARFGGPR